MFDLNSNSDLLLQCKAVTADEPDLIANLANISAIIFDGMADINWAGFYFARKPDELVLGPFQGKVACVRIPFGKGVCGTAAAEKQLQHVDDVHQFSGHIACDAASNSEVVAPIIVNGEVVAVLDIDSPSVARFSKEDAQQIGLIADYCAQLDWTLL
jgi:GAF domain-containing protein